MAEPIRRGPGLFERLWIIACSGLFTYFFFLDYLPPRKRVHIPYDLQGYHYPLADTIFRAFKAWRFPLWDPAIYCGISLVGNVQAGLFYPPFWLLILLTRRHEHLSYEAFQIFEIAHVWLAFVFAYMWLRGRSLAPLASALGAGAIAYGGYASLQLQHLGLIITLAWFPLGFMAIDQAVDRSDWFPLWKLVLASAMCFLGGYPPAWFVFAIAMGMYTIATTLRPRMIISAALALLASLAIAMVQLLPSWEISHLMVHVPRYGPVRNLSYLVSYLVPNFYNFGLHVPSDTNPGKEYLYLGAPVIIGLLLLIRFRNPRVLLPLSAVGITAVILLTNPLNIVESAIHHSWFLEEIVRAWYFLPTITVALAALAAYGIDDFLKGEGSWGGQRWLGWCMAAIAIGYAMWQLRARSGDSAPIGVSSILDAGMTLAIAAAALFVLRLQTGRARIVLAYALVLMIGIDYKVFGAGKRVNAVPGPGPRLLLGSFPSIDQPTFEKMRDHRQYRIALDSPGAPFPLDLRFWDFSTPQGFDPFLSQRYRDLVAGFSTFESDRLFSIDFTRKDALDLLGVRYVISAAIGPNFDRLQSDPDFVWISDHGEYYRVFEYRRAQPPYGFENPDAGQKIDMTAWEPERRAFTVHSNGPARFTLREEFVPGWNATLDGGAVPVDFWHGAFQAVTIPAGDHRIEFRYQPRSVVTGAWISIVSILILTAVFAGTARRRKRTPGL